MFDLSTISLKAPRRLTKRRLFKVLGAAILFGGF